MKGGENMNNLTPNDIENMYKDMIQPNQELIGAVGNVLLAIFQGVQETARAAVIQALQEAQQNQNK